MITGKIGVRYAKALFSQSVEQGSLEKINEDMAFIAKTSVDNREFGILLNSPIIKAEIKNNVLNTLLNGKVDALTLRFIELITGKRRESYLPAVAFNFGNLYREHKGIVVAKVKSAVAIDKSVEEQIISILSKSYPGKTFELEKTVDSTLLGGFVLTVGDRQIDQSVSSSLRRMTQAFNSNVYISAN